MRKVSTPEVLHTAWGSLLNLQTAFGLRDVRLILREGATNYAVKTVPLWRADGAHWGAVEDVFGAIRSVGAKNVQTLILAADRPLGYLDCFNVASNLQFELPGGTVDKGETAVETAVREYCEEGGVEAHNIAGVAELFPSHAISAGSAPEMYSAYVALCNTLAQPPAIEGIDPESCIVCSLDKALESLQQLQAQKEAVELLAFTAHLALSAKLRN